MAFIFAQVSTHYFWLSFMETGTSKNAANAGLIIFGISKK
jgi:hypothetical protein